jgi:hypothetical protein
VFSASFFNTFLSPEIASVNIHVPFSLSWVMVSGLLLGMVLSVCSYLAFLTSFHLISLHAHTSVFCPVLPLSPCICWSVVEHTFCHVFSCTVLLPVLSMLI